MTVELRELLLAISEDVPSFDDVGRAVARRLVRRARVRRRWAIGAATVAVAAAAVVVPRSLGVGSQSTTEPAAVVSTSATPLSTSDLPKSSSSTGRTGAPTTTRDPRSASPRPLPWNCGLRLDRAAMIAPGVESRLSSTDAVAWSVSIVNGAEDRVAVSGEETVIVALDSDGTVVAHMIHLTQDLRAFKWLDPGRTWSRVFPDGRTGPFRFCAGNMSKGGHYTIVAITDVASDDPAIHGRVASNPVDVISDGAQGLRIA